MEDRQKKIEDTINYLKENKEIYNEVKTEATLNGETLEEHINKMFDKEQDIIEDCEIIFTIYICGNPALRKKRIYFIINHEDDIIETSEELYFYHMLTRYKPQALEKYSMKKQEEILNKLINKTLTADNEEIYKIMDAIEDAKKEAERQAKHTEA